jgi:hypothetical protein
MEEGKRRRKRRRRGDGKSIRGRSGKGWAEWAVWLAAVLTPSKYG